LAHRRDFKALEQRRLKGAKLLARGVPAAEVARKVGVERQTVAAWQRLLEEKGVAGLKRRTLGWPRELSDAQCAELGKLLVQGALAQGFPTELWTLPRGAKLIKQRFGVAYSSGDIWHLQRRVGFSCQKPARRATQLDEAAIERWTKRCWSEIEETLPTADKPSSS
jgi:transposase